MIKWNEPADKGWHYGLDHGVLYVPGEDPVPWNGLTAFDEGSAGTSSVLYRDGQIYLADVDASDFSGKLSTLYYPESFNKCIGMPEVVEGFYADNQKPKRFGFCYRTLVGSGVTGDLFGYQIHLVYNAFAVIAPRSRKTLGNNAEPVAFDFDIVCTPVKLAGYRPSAHYIIDTRHLDTTTVKELEDLLYGTATESGSLPDPQTIFELLNFGDSIKVTVHANQMIGLAYPVSIKTYTVQGASSKVYATDVDGFKVDGANVVDHGDGTWTVSDGTNTTVIIE